MKFVWYTDWDQLPESADALFERAQRNSLFFSRPWFECLVGSLDDESMVLACVLAESKVLAILSLLKSAVNTGYALRHRYTSLYSLLLADDDQQRVLACLVDGLSQLSLNALLLEPVADDDGRLEALQGVMEAAGYRCDRAFRFYNWFLRVQGQSSSDYMAARPARLRNTIARKKRKLEREHGYEIRLFTGAEVPHKISDYYAVYNASWKANEQYTELVDAMVAGFSKRGWTRLAVLYIKGRPAAAQLWFVHHGNASIFRLSYDQAWKQYSPGSLLTSYLMEYVIDIDKVEEVDFLAGNDAYKQDWMSDRRERVAWSAVKSVKPGPWYRRSVESMRRMLKTR
jgi:hypothetical protein